MYVGPVVTLLRINSLEISAQNVVSLIGNVVSADFSSQQPRHRTFALDVRKNANSVMLLVTYRSVVDREILTRAYNE